MPKLHSPPSLNLAAARPNTDELGPASPSTPSLRSPRSPQSPPSLPASPFNSEHTIHARLGNKGQINNNNALPPTTLPANSQPTTVKTTLPVNNNGSTSPEITAIPEPPLSPLKISPRHGRDPSKSFFSNLMASKSSHRLQSPESGVPASTERATSKNRANSKDRSLHSLRRQESTPDLPRSAQTNDSVAVAEPEQSAVAQAPQMANENGHTQAGVKKNKSRFGGILNRSKSIKTEDSTSFRPRMPSRLDTEARPIQSSGKDSDYPEPMKTAPVLSSHRQQLFPDDTGSTKRNRSADRQPPPITDNAVASLRTQRAVNVPNSQSFREGGTLNILSNIHHTGNRLGRASKGFLGKITRSGSSNEREVTPDDNYTCTVINLPLVKQTRMTRIARRLELSKDKTEFWMPALPWRCIDYLNMNGCEEEGLYRIPGSGKDVKHWQRRFDSEFDINLFDEPDLYDINTIGSMFKSWLRELPDEIIPKDVQLKIAKECAGAVRTPKLLKDELSKLPPFNYYLLFAITCHLSLLHSFADKNKMDYRNLCICFQPCLKIDGFVFQFLVQDWKNCWQGCWTEKEYLEEELRYEREGSIAKSDEHSADERAVSSSDSSQHAPAMSDVANSAIISSPGSKSQQQHLPSTDASGIINGGDIARSSSPTVASAGFSAMPHPRDTRDPRNHTHPSPKSKLPELGHMSPLKM